MDRIVYCVETDLALSQHHDKIDMMTARHRVGPCRYRDGGGKWGNFTGYPRTATLDFPRPCQLTCQIRSFTFGNPSSAYSPVRQSANPSACPPVCALLAPVRLSARLSIVRPRPLVRSEPSSTYAAVRPPVRPVRLISSVVLSV